MQTKPLIKSIINKNYACGCIILDLCFTILSSRIIYTSLNGADSNYFSTLFIASINFYIAYRNPKSTLFIFTLTAPLLSGLTQVQALASTPLLFLSFSALWLGTIVNRWTLFEEKQRLHLYNKSADTSRWFFLAADILCFILVASAANFIAISHEEINIWPTTINCCTLGFADRYYTLQSAHIWLSGLFYFKLCALYKLQPKQDFIIINNNTQAQSLVKDGVQKTNYTSALMPNELACIIFFYAYNILIFGVFQHFTRVPEPLGLAFLSSPYEDIHSLGAITVSICAMLIVFVRIKNLKNTTIYLFIISSLSYIIIMTYSRATWLAAIFGALFLLKLRLSTRWFVFAFLVSISIWLAVNVSAKNNSIWINNAYLARFHSLVRIESLSTKSTSRFELYNRALKMIRSEPIFGHGIGSFYLKSIKFAEKGDSWFDKPNFAHNFILQFAAELGIPATLLFCSLVGAAWYKGYRITRADLKAKNGNRIPLALFLALTTYLITQMTANSLNIYVSHQFFFWFLIAALLTLPESKAENRPNAIG